MIALMYNTRDDVVAKSNASELSAAVVFLPEHTLLYGKHGSDRCYCRQMYGKDGSNVHWG